MVTANFRAKLSEKKLPFTTSNVLFICQLIDKDLNLDEFIEKTNNYYTTCLRHGDTDFADVIRKMFGLKL